MSILEHLTNLFAPDDCLSCGREGSLLCSECFSTLPLPPGRCFGCDISIQGVSCDACLQRAGLFSLIAASHYDGLSRALVARLKFSGNQSAARIIATTINPLVRLERCIVTHMPATAQHIRQRGYDQAELIAQHLVKWQGCAHMTLLARSGVRHQLGANREQRLEQMQQSLRVLHSEKIYGARIVLIDDVLTTGASLRAAAKALLRAGAVRVDAVVFAQAVSGK